jgi:predicted DNA-binding transcriptional regulator AlpA
MTIKKRQTPDMVPGVVPRKTSYAMKDTMIDGRNQPADAVAPELLTLRQAAELCAVSDRTLSTWATSGISPAPVRIGKGTVRYSRPAYLAWIAAGCKPIPGGGDHA